MQLSYGNLHAREILQLGRNVDAAEDCHIKRTLHKACCVRFHLHNMQHYRLNDPQ
jgi:hypothetical protein